MIVVIILLAAFLISLAVFKLAGKQYEEARSARVAMSAMLIMTAIGHFLFTKGMVMMLPDIVPYRTELVYFTGVIEIAAAIGLCLSRFRKLTAWLLIIFFTLLLPANIYQATHHVNLEKATFDGSGPNYLWFRIPLQLFFIGWVYLSSLHIAKSAY